MNYYTLAASIPIDKLTCASCNNYLSYFPVWVSSKNENFCGRCTPPENETTFQNTAFEILSQFLKFPCRYKDAGCEQTLLPKNIPEHEKECTFRIIRCPVDNTNCQWEGQRTDILHHCRNDHSNQFLNGEFAINLKQSLKTKHLIEHDNVLLFFSGEYNTETRIFLFEIHTSCFEPQVRIFSSQLSVKCGNKNLSFDFTTTSFQEINHNELCLDSVIDDDQIASFELSIGEELQDSKNELNFDMLSVLKCFVCSEYAVPPIHHCVENSETLCSECRTKHQSSCDSCLRNTTGTRNINLDKIADLLNYPCKNHKNGCTYISKPETIKKHESLCELGDFECPINEFKSCSWKGLWKGLEEHIQNSHQELITNATQISKQLLPQHMKCDIIKYSGKYFRLVSLKTLDEKYMWSVQVVGPFQNNFKFEIEIVDPSDKGRKLLVRQQCSPFTKRADVFKRGDNYCYFLKEQISGFVVDQVVTFKVQIFS